MANSNVRFYKLATLPDFEAKYNGIFVHVTSKLIRLGKEGKYTYTWGKLKDGDVENIVIQKIGEEPTLVPRWMDLRGIDIVESGLWFGGENGWELLSNDTTDAAITAAINALDAGTIQAVTTGPAEGNTANTVLTFNGIKEENGKILQGDGTSKFTVGDAKLKIQIGSATATDVFSANAQSDSTIQLDGYVFRKDENNVISVITENPVSGNNKLVTQQDIANLSGAMHYKGALTGAPSGDGSWPSTVAAGDVYIVTTGFTHSGESNPFEVGDMIVFNTDNDNSKFTVVQSNLTLGTGTGQIAKNDGALANGNLVVATGNGIKTTEISATVLEASNNTRNLTYTNGAADTSNATLFHSATITDSLKIMNRDFNESINISSTNRSIKIARNGGDNDSTGIVVDLVWNTILE